MLMSLFLRGIQEDSDNLVESDKERFVEGYNNYIQRLRHHDALNVLKQLLESFPQDAEILVRHAYLLDDCLGDHKTALESLAVILGEGDKQGIHPQHREALNLRIEINHEERNFELILKDTNCLLALDAEDITALRYRAEAYYQLQRFDEALLDLNRLLSDENLLLKPLPQCDFIDVRYLRAHIYYLEYQKAPTSELRRKLFCELNILIGDMPAHGEKDYANPEALLLRSDFCQAEELYQYALNDLNRYLSSHIISEDALKRRIAVCRVLGDHQQVILDKAAISRLKRQPNPVEEAAALLAYRKRKDQAALHEQLAEDSGLESGNEETCNTKRRRYEK
ncbi:MAG: hypothetical protein P1U32_08715 [Legionellaceae bacterium]|nr:hypothetical protein [Legionellaceae bacterium]